MKVTNVVLSIGIAVAIFYGLAIGRALLVPFVIDLDIQAYVRVKTFVSLVTALLSYAVMMYVELPFADFGPF